MAAENWEKCFQMVLKHEGGFVNHPKDPGGMTNLGVTKRAWEQYVGQNVDEAEMRGLTPEKVKPFYKPCIGTRLKATNFRLAWTMLLMIWQ